MRPTSRAGGDWAFVLVSEREEAMLHLATPGPDAAMQALQSTGIEWPTVSGPWEWAHQGKRLDEIRREIEDNSD